jgi:hypothetical protein
MNPMPELIPMLKSLRLSGVLDSLETRNRQAIDKKLSYTEFLGLILQDETARRAHKKLQLALRRANFRNQKTLEDFDFTFNPSINQALVMDLAPAAPAKATSPRLWDTAPSGWGMTSCLQPKAKCSQNCMLPEPPTPMNASSTS